MPFQWENRETQAVAIPFAQLPVPFRFQQQGEVCKLWHRVRPTEIAVKQNVQRRAWQPLFPADHMGDFHQMVIHDIRQVISREFVCRFVKHLVVQDRRVDDDLATYDIMHMDILVGFNLHTHHILMPRLDQGLCLFCRKRKGIAHLRTGRSVILEIGNLLALCIQLLRSIKSDVSMTRFQQLVNIFLIYFPAFALAIRTIIPAKTYSLIEMNAQPCQSFNDVGFRPWDKTLGIRVFYTKD